MRVADERFQPGRLRFQHSPAQRGQTVIPAAIVIAAGIGDQAQFDETCDRGIERPRAEPQVATGTGVDVLNEGISMPLAIGQGKQDVELMSRERQKAGRIVHTSNLDTSSLDGVGGQEVGSWRLEWCSWVRGYGGSETEGTEDTERASTQRLRDTEAAESIFVFFFTRYVRASLWGPHRHHESAARPRITGT